MALDTRLLRLGHALYAIGAMFVVGVPLLMWRRHDGSGWNPSQPEDEQMMTGIYVTLGIFLLRAVRDPMRHASPIWFTVWSSVVHGGVMAVQAVADGSERTNLLGDVPAPVLVAVLAVLTPAALPARGLRCRGARHLAMSSVRSSWLSSGRRYSYQMRTPPSGSSSAVR
jgi:hypothetical protein